MPQRYSRHYYDLYCMAKSPVKEKAFERMDLLRNMLYGEIPSFETMMEAVGELEKEIHTL